MTETIIDWLQSSGLRIAVIVIIVWILRKFGNIAIRKLIKRTVKANSNDENHAIQKRTDTLFGIISTTARVLLWVIAGILIVQEFGIDTGPLVAGASVIGFALGFGAQSIVKDFVSGLFIILENQYRVGDIISVAGVGGVVESVTMRETVLRDLDGYVHHIPNGLVEVATNKTIDYSGININLGVAYNTDIENVSTVINDVGLSLKDDAEWGSHILEAPYFSRVRAFGASEVELKVLGAVEPGMQWAVAGEFRKRIMVAFNKHKIEIPFPQLDVHQKK